MEAARLLPPGASAALVSWPLPPDESDEAIERPAADAIIRALLHMGRLAFRCEPEPAAGGVLHPCRPQSLADRLIGHLNSFLHPWHLGDRAVYDVMETSAPGVARLLFDWEGWRVGLQAALVFDPAADPGPVVRAVQRGLDWRRRSLPPGSLLLFGSGHDGAEAVVAARSQSVLDDFGAALDGSLSMMQSGGVP